MSFVNERLGNGFVMLPVDSSKDQEHYFTNAKKHIEFFAQGAMTGTLDFRFVSGSTDDYNDWVFFDTKSDNFGNAYTVGSKRSGSFIQSWTIFRSTDEGEDWEEKYELIHDAIPNADNGAKEIAIKSDGTVFVVGVIREGSTSKVHCVRSVDNGDTWEGVYTYTPSTLTSDPAIAINSEDENDIALFHPSSVGNTIVVTSSAGGDSGSFVSIGTAALRYSNGILFSGSNTLYMCGRDYSAVPSVVLKYKDIIGHTGWSSGSASVVYGAEGSAPHWNEHFSDMYLEGNGKIWAVGTHGVLTSSAGISGTWYNASEALNLLDHPNQRDFRWVGQDYYGNIWLSNYTVSGSYTTLLYSSGSGEDWTKVNFVGPGINGISSTDQYKSLLCVGFSGNYGTIYKTQPLSIINQGDRLFNAPVPSELLFELTFKDAKTSSSFTNEQKEDYFIGLGNNPEEISNFSPEVGIYFSGSEDNFIYFQEISLAPVTGSFEDIRTFGHILNSSPSSSFTTRGLAKSQAPDTIAYMKLKISGSDILENLPFSRFQFKYLQLLTSNGVEFFKDLENQNLSFSNVNMSVLKNVENAYFIGSNSASLGPNMFATSIKYDDKFELVNISEFPHSAGIFQMPNMILGTSYSGKLGSTEDDIIQVNYFGSVVYVMWPKQVDQNIPVKGFGDFAIGQRVGRLTTGFEPGEVIDVTDHDHLALYCYLTKEVSGTLDSIEVKVERKPLKDSGFTTDQAIEYETSGSDTIAKLRDVVFKKEVNYGDLSLKEVGYVIDVPLTNVKELRISSKQTVGQLDEENRNFIVWGRLVNSEEET